MTQDGFFQTLRNVISNVAATSASILWLFFAVGGLPEVARAQTAPQGYPVPQFRIPGTEAVPNFAPGTEIRLLMDQDFAPYSFVSTSGAPAGLAAELALAACSEMKVQCTVVPLTYGALTEALERGEGDVIVAGPRLDADMLARSEMTRPWFRLMGRFAVQGGNPATDARTVTLAGKRIGVVRDTTHARWIQAYYETAEIVPFENEAEAGDALRTGNVDAIFGDDLRIIYWVAGEASRGCCRLLDGAFTDFDYFSRNLAFLVTKRRDDLRAAFDYGLDAAQKSGATAKIFNAYVPLNPW